MASAGTHCRGLAVFFSVAADQFDEFEPPFYSALAVYIADVVFHCAGRNKEGFGDVFAAHAVAQQGQHLFLTGADFVLTDKLSGEVFG